MSQELLAQATRLTKAHSRDVAKSVLADRLQHEWGFDGALAKGLAESLCDGDPSSLNKAMRARSLRKDHKPFKGYSWDPDEENSKRPYDAMGSPGSYPVPMTDDPQFKPGQPPPIRPKKTGIPENAGMDVHPPMNEGGPNTLAKACDCDAGALGAPAPPSTMTKPGPGHDHSEKFERLLNDLKGQGYDAGAAHRIAYSQLKEGGPPVAGGSESMGVVAPESPHRDMTQKSASPRCGCGGLAKAPAAAPEPQRMTEIDVFRTPVWQKPAQVTPEGGLSNSPDVDKPKLKKDQNPVEQRRRVEREPEDPARPEGHQSPIQGRGGPTNDGSPNPEANFPPQEGFYTGEDSPDGEQSQLAGVPGRDSSPGTTGAGRIGLGAGNAGPTTPDMPTSLPGLSPMPDRATTQILDMLTPQEQDALIQLLLGMQKDDAPPATMGAP